MALKTIDDFNCSLILTNSTNDVQLCTNKLDHTNWYTKRYDNVLYALNHLLAKNFYNLFTPHSHKAILIQSGSDKLLAISEIQTYTHINDFFCYDNGVHYDGVPVTHLLENIIIALLIDDWDIIEGNIGFFKSDANNYGVKIDFDESFLRILNHNITLQTFCKPAGSIVKECYHKAIITDAVKSVVARFTHNYNTLLDQCMQDASDSFTNAEIYNLSVTIQSDIWANGFFKYHPIQSVTSNSIAIQQLCESIMPNIKNRAEELEGVIQQLNTMTDVDYAYAIANLPFDDHPYEDYSFYMREKQKYAIHEDL